MRVKREMGAEDVKSRPHVLLPDWNSHCLPATTKSYVLGLMHKASQLSSDHVWFAGCAADAAEAVRERANCPMGVCRAAARAVAFRKMGATAAEGAVDLFDDCVGPGWLYRDAHVHHTFRSDYVCCSFRLRPMI